MNPNFNLLNATPDPSEFDYFTFYQHQQPFMTIEQPTTQETNQLADFSLEPDPVETEAQKESMQVDEQHHLKHMEQVQFEKMKEVALFMQTLKRDPIPVEKTIPKPDQLAYELLDYQLKSVRLQKELLNHLPEPYNKWMIMMLYFQMMSTGCTPGQAMNYVLEECEGLSQRTFLKWQKEFIDEDNHLMDEIPLVPSRAGSRHWLLESHPELVVKAKEWLQSKFHKERRFKIVEFQEYLNTELLVPFFQEKRMSPVSHSTAKTWLQKLGYYEEFKNQKMSQTGRHRSNTWTPGMARPELKK